MRKGFALVTVLIMLVVLMSLLTAYFTLTRIELGATQASVRQTTGFYAAEGGLNLRAEEVRARFLGYGEALGNQPLREQPLPGEQPRFRRFCLQDLHHIRADGAHLYGGASW